MKDHFPDTKAFVVNYNKISTPGTVRKHCPGFSCIHSKYYELYVKIDETELEKQLDHTSNNKVNSFHKNIMFIEE